MKGFASRLEEKCDRVGRLIFWIVFLHLLLLVYAPSLKGPFVYDDIPSILENPDFRAENPVAEVLGAHETSLQFDKRPVGGLLTLLNYGLGGIHPFGYRVTNLLIHWLTAMVLAEMILAVSRACGLSGRRLFALGIASVWALHPLNSVLVGYVYQRMESLMALFYLLALLCLLRAGRSESRQRGWLAACLGCAALSMLSKEVAVSLPASMILLERICVWNRWRDLWLARWRFYALLAAIWMAMVAWVLSGARMGEIVVANELSHPWVYFKTQCRAIATYLKLSLWPDPLVFVRMPQFVTSSGQWLPHAVLLVGLLGSVVAVGRRARWVLLPGLMFFIVLSPTSSFVPVPLEPVAEFRMYLPLACVAVLLAAAFLLAVRRMSLSADTVGLVFLLVLAALGTVSRNRAKVYANPIALWNDVVSKQPLNFKGWGNLAEALLAKGDLSGASRCADNLTKLAERFPGRFGMVPALRLKGMVALRGHRPEDAARLVEEALAMEPDNPELMGDLAAVHVAAGRYPEAVRTADMALGVRPNIGAAHIAKSEALLALERIPEAQAAIRLGLKTSPGSRRLLELGRLAGKRPGSAE